MSFACCDDRAVLPLSRVPKTADPSYPFVVFMVTVCGFLLTACGGTSLVDPLHVEHQPRRIAGLSYGPLSRQRLDLYLPPAESDVSTLREIGANTKIVIFFYGGGWQSGNRTDYAFVGHALAERGHVVIIPDHRLFPEVRFPDFVLDSAAAVRWLIEQLGGDDGGRLYLVGHSTGAHTVALLALDPEYQVSDHVSGWVGIAGPYDFLPIRTPVLRAIFAVDDDDDLSRTQPVTSVSSRAPPSLLLTGNNDAIVSPGNSIRLAELLREAGADTELVLYPQVDHQRIIMALAPALRELAPTLRDLDAFIRRR